MSDKPASLMQPLTMRSFAEAWPDEQIVQQPVGQLLLEHNLVLPNKFNKKVEVTHCMRSKFLLPRLK